MSDDENEKDLSEGEENSDTLDAELIKKGLSDCELAGSSGRKAFAFVRLELPKKEIKNLGTDIALFKEIEHINLSHNELTTIEPLNQLLCLTCVNVQKNNISSVSGFGAGLENLQRLQLDFNQVEDLQNFSIPSLKILTAASNLITGFSDVPEGEKPMQLEALDLSKNIVTSLNGIGVFKELRVLNLQGNKLDSVQGIEVLTKLEKLHLGANQLSPQDLNMLQALPRLTDLILTGNTNIYEDPELASDFLSKVLLMMPRLQSFDGNEITAEDRAAAQALKEQQEAEAAAAAAALVKQAEEEAAAEAAAMAEAAAAEVEGQAAEGEGDGGGEDDE